MARTVSEGSSVLARLLRRALVGYYRFRGWKAVGIVPEPRRFVLIAAPHTSNWDFVFFLGLTEDLGIRPHFMGKKSLFRWPMGNFMRQMGGISIDRTGSGNVVQAMADEFARRDEFMLTIAPEGTRGATRRWKTGFYQIALAAKVPIVVGLMDYARKTGGLGPTIWPTGDYAADMAKLMDIYRTVVPRHPHKATIDIVADSDPVKEAA